GAVRPAQSGLVREEGIPGSPTEAGRDTGHETSIATGTKSPFGWRRLRIGVLWALAASLLVLLGYFVGRVTTRSGDKAFEVLLADARPRAAKERGGPEAPKAILGNDNTFLVTSEGDFVVEIRSPRKGFATIILFGDDTPPEVFPAPGQPDLSVQPFV